MSKVFDCHYKNYLEVEDQFENWVLVNQDSRPLHVITGRSTQMKELIIKEASKLGFKTIEWHYNPGLIIVI
jgi:hypothetical protein